MEVSVLIAVYNVSAYIQSCLDDILSQSFQDMEIILVDDGSTDGSAAICDEYAKKDERVNVFHESHSGVAHSRQVGLDNAKGKYILFVDADDQVETDMISDMYQQAETLQADMVICDYRELTHGGEVYRKQESTALDGVVVLNDILEGKLYGALWNKMMRREWLLETKASFPQSLAMREDLIFLSQCLPVAKKIAYIPKAYYGYERRNVSALTSNYVNESLSYYNQECLWVDLIVKNKFLKEEVRLRLEQYYFRLSYITLLRGLFDKRMWDEKFKNHARLLEYGSGFRKVIVGLACHGHFCMAQLLRTFISQMK